MKNNQANRAVLLNRANIFKDILGKIGPNEGKMIFLMPF